MFVIAVTRFRIVFEVGSGLNRLSTASVDAWPGFKLVSRLISEGAGVPELLAPEGRRERRRPKNDISTSS